MGVASGQQPDAGWHRFHDKEGNEIEARAVSVSSDLKTVQIYRRDGRSFDLTVTRLSLDDQQYLREWILAESTNDASKARFRVSLNRKEKPLAKEKLSTPIREALWETSELSYGIEVTNQSSTSVANLQLEYAILMEDHVDVKPAPEPTDPDQAADEPDAVAQRWRAVPEGSVRYHKGKIPLPLLAFNRPHPLEIGTLVC
ncbi:MAG: hypothetical protein KDM64_18190, partial [Verrucomicrobiae bacterium]|nr:hypothetical protein [Verrucomicrobiae bacterium]